MGHLWFKTIMYGTLFALSVCRLRDEYRRLHGRRVYDLRR